MMREEIQERVLEKFGVWCSLTTISRTLEQHGETYKKVTIYQYVVIHLTNILLFASFQKGPLNGTKTSDQRTSVILQQIIQLTSSFLLTRALSTSVPLSGTVVGASRG